MAEDAAAPPSVPAPVAEAGGGSTQRRPSVVEKPAWEGAGGPGEEGGAASSAAGKTLEDSINLDMLMSLKRAFKLADKVRGPLEDGGGAPRARTREG